MLHDIGKHVFDNAYRKVQVQKNCRVLWYSQDAICVRNHTAQIELPTAEELNVDYEHLCYLFSIDDEQYFLAFYHEEVSKKIPAGYQFKSISSIRAAQPPELVLAVCVGWQLARWYESNRFCGCCGSRMEHAPKSREMVCPNCAHIVYPKIAPGVIVGIVDPQTERIVLTTYANRPHARAALVAGFTEIGESLEQTVAREVYEEVGLSVKNLRYYSSQPWPFSDSLLVGFFCEVAGSKTLKVDCQELKCAEWVAKHDVPSRSKDTISLTGEMMKLFKERGSAVLESGVMWEGER